MANLQNVAINLLLVYKAKDNDSLWRQNNCKTTQLLLPSFLLDVTQTIVKIKYVLQFNFYNQKYIKIYSIDIDKMISC